MADLNKQALEMWNAMKPMIDREIEQQTRGAVQRRKAKVTTAPSLSTGKMGVTEPFGDQYFIPFTTNLSTAKVGDVVWVEYMYGATNAFASMYASADTKDWTIGGVLDVVKRRCSETLSSAGWYRACDISGLTLGMVQGSLGFVIKLNITRRGSSADAESHTVTFRAINGGNGGFIEESSKSGSMIIDKIRYTYDGNNNGHIDIHYNSSGQNVVSVFFDVYAPPATQANFTANSLQSIADAPIGETILTTYGFNAQFYPSCIKTYVDTTTANYTIGSSHYASVNYPAGINPTNCIGISLYVFSSISGPATFVPYGQAASDTAWYIIGDAGVTLNGVKFRYWYI